MSDFLTPPVGETGLRAQTLQDRIAQLSAMLSGMVPGLVNPQTQQPNDVMNAMIQFPLGKGGSLSPGKASALRDLLTQSGRYTSMQGGMRPNRISPITIDYNQNHTPAMTSSTFEPWISDRPVVKSGPDALTSREQVGHSELWNRINSPTASSDEATSFIDMLTRLFGGSR